MKKKTATPRRANAPQPKAEKLSRTRAPAKIPPMQWQQGLRRQYGREQNFGWENLGTEPFFSEFRVSNPD